MDLGGGRRLSRKTHPAGRLGRSQELSLTRAGARSWRPGDVPAVWRIALYSVLFRGGGGGGGGGGDVGVLLLRLDPENPAPSDIARICKHVIRCGSKGAEQPEIQRLVWSDAVLGRD